MNVYCIYFPNGKRYVEVESNEGKRISFHAGGYGMKLKCPQVVSHAIKKHGWERCRWRYLIKNASQSDGWKLLGHPVSFQTREKLRKANTGQPAWNKGVKGSIKPNSGTFKKGDPAPIKGKIALPSGPNGETRYFHVEQLI